MQSVETEGREAEQTKVPKNHYVDNERLNEELVSWKSKCREAEDAGQEPPPIPPFVANAILQIGRGLARAPQFIMYSFKEDMVSEGALVCCSYLKNYNPDAKTRKGKPNAFSYISRIMFTSFINFIMAEKDQDYYKCKSLEMMGLEEGDLAELQSLNPQVEGGVDIVNDIINRAHQHEENRRRRLNASREKAKSKEIPKPTPVNLLEIFGESE